MSDERLLTGRTEAPEARRILHAGPVTAILEGADLRHVRIGPVELVQRVYVAVRDAPWNTIPATYGDWELDVRDDRFTVAFTARHRHEAIAFAWRGRIEGTTAGRIRYEMDGACDGAFQQQDRVHVHHAPTVRSTSVSGPTASGELRGAPVTSIRSESPADLRHVRSLPNSRSRPSTAFSQWPAEGDLLSSGPPELTDANFKSYATPLALGFLFDSIPVDVPDRSSRSPARTSRPMRLTRRA
jgi:hypothetical protein